MSVITVEEVKLANNITVTTYDAAIEAQIPVVQDLVSEYTNQNYISVSQSIDSFNGSFFNTQGRSQRNTTKGYEIWTSPNVSASGQFVFDSTGKTITASTALFSNFQAGDSIVVFNATRNQGYLTIASLTDTVLTVAEDIIDETDFVDIYLVIYPKSVLWIMKRMVGWDVLKRNQTTGLESERIGTYSWKMKDIGGSIYPLDIVNGLKRFHKGK